METRVQKYMKKWDKDQMVSLWNNVIKECAFLPVLARYAVLDVLEEKFPESYEIWIKLPRERRSIEKFFEIVDEHKNLDVECPSCNKKLIKLDSEKGAGVCPKCSMIYHEDEIKNIRDAKMIEEDTKIWKQNRKFA